MNDPNVVSPGILGFLAFFFLAVALYLLLRNMNGHLRRMRYRAEQMESEAGPADLEAGPADPEAGPAEPGEPTTGEPPPPAQPEDERDRPA